MKKGRLKIVLIAIILLIIIGGVVATIFYPKKPAETNNPAPSGPSGPSRCSLVAKNDTYVKPDFSRLESVMAEQPIVKDVPKSGKISLKFYHITEDCKIWDKAYILSDGKITAGDGASDMQIWISSNYVDRITVDNFCDIAKEAINSGDFGKSMTASKITLLWRYSGMLKYKDCLGIEI